MRDLAIYQLQQSFLLSDNLEVDGIRDVFDYKQRRVLERNFFQSDEAVFKLKYLFFQIGFFD